MDKRMKWSIGAACASMIVLSMLLVYPTPMTRVSLVISAPSFDNTTRIYEIDIDNTDNLMITYFSENSTTQNIPVGEILNRIQVRVYVNKEFAATENYAHAYTRVYVTLKNPSNSTVWENYLENTTVINDLGTYWRVLKRRNVISTIELTEGTWTIIAKYDVYA